MQGRNGKRSRADAVLAFARLAARAIFQRSQIRHARRRRSRIANRDLGTVRRRDCARCARRAASCMLWHDCRTRRACKRIAQQDRGQAWPDRPLSTCLTRRQTLAVLALCREGRRVFEQHRVGGPGGEGSPAKPSHAACWCWAPARSADLRELLQGAGYSPCCRSPSSCRAFSPQRTRLRNPESWRALTSAMTAASTQATGHRSARAEPRALADLPAA